MAVLQLVLPLMRLHILFRKWFILTTVDALPFPNPQHVGVNIVFRVLLVAQIDGYISSAAELPLQEHGVKGSGNSLVV